MYTSGIARLLAGGVQSLTNIRNKDKVLEISKGHAHLYPGNYQEYIGSL